LLAPLLSFCYSVPLEKRVAFPVVNKYNNSRKRRGSKPVQMELSLNNLPATCTALVSVADLTRYSLLPGRESTDLFTTAARRTVPASSSELEPRGTALEAV
jgi:hypothetical protein